MHFRATVESILRKRLAEAVSGSIILYVGGTHTLELDQSYLLS